MTIYIYTPILSYIYMCVCEKVYENANLRIFLTITRHHATQFQQRRFSAAGRAAAVR
jgi:hypothetical protein